MVSKFIITIIESYDLFLSFDSGSGPMKSMPIMSLGVEGMDNGFNSPNGF